MLAWNNNGLKNDDDDDDDEFSQTIFKITHYKFFEIVSWVSIDATSDYVFTKFIFDLNPD